ncbi:fatty acyl-AMP ligase [Nocardia asteroides]|uniref:fatty acyl-AMP ligase n=1 Tax=Nocardia asteroides TaxID=1824 RepID=UPI0037CC7824
MIHESGALVRAGAGVLPDVPAVTETLTVTTVVGALRQRSMRTPGRVLFTFLPDGDDEEQLLTFATLDTKARAVAAVLRSQVEPGSRAMLLFAPGVDFIVAFFGCLYAGVVAVPTYLPRPDQRSFGMLRVAGVAEDARPSVVMTTSKLRPMIEPAASSIPELQGVCWLSIDTVSERDAAQWSEPGISADSLAFLQYTSGSTGQPKGVMVTHGNLVHNIDMIRAALDLDDSSVIVGWLPPYHDMGLISMIILPALIGSHSVLMPTLAFLQKPVRWLRAFTKYRGTASAAPNFAFELCARKVTEADISELDLSSWVAVADGAEPIRVEQLRRFCDRFAATGFRPETIVPVYGLAECTLLVAAAPRAQPRVFRAFDSNGLELGIAHEIDELDPSARVLASCGVSNGVEVAIVDPQDHVRRAPGRIGEIWISGNSVAAGYWQRPDLTAEMFQARLRDGENRDYLRTGDLGFLTDEGLFVVGRTKDVIIVGGRNHYPQDIERTTELAHIAVRPGCVAVFGVEHDGAEAVVVALELRREFGDALDSPDVTAVAGAVRRAVMSEHRLPVRDIVVVPAGSLPKTSSGKLQRNATRKEYLNGASPWDRKI